MREAAHVPPAPPARPAKPEKAPSAQALRKIAPRNYNAVIDAPFGKVGIVTGEDGVRDIVYLPGDTPGLAPNSALAERAAVQIVRYLDDAAAPFDLPLAPLGTDFQRRVWDGICSIGLGSVLTYGELAQRVGTINARAVGQACGSNYFPIVIPCHRVVSASGIGGFSHHGGDGFFRDVKRWLLAHEGVTIR
ncbi:methylated-DNA--[protein]-cysteine S-methyltransferase [Burkholderia sp. Ax-1719]|nr:methylated-DNA--[protein]-cysteine S-methyltransferase [Burkholderia sp. Ax-1719]